MELAGAALTLAVPAASQKARAAVEDNTVTYGGAFGAGVDLAYEVTPEALKETVVLHAPPREEAVHRFSVRAEGLRRRRGDDDRRPPEAAWWARRARWPRRARWCASLSAEAGAEAGAGAGADAGRFRRADL
ncbi:hypothetical protein HD597_005013 [Nonomuraea thailandensis]|uniref:Uncharacterized protein n=1 Tax=Nonomuraea thailandensis TaxID=1188745 RepID=A0A9X2GNP1_9ACTN|nr:hypothetical protein [Nonomuraea thailandensis]MCP2357993.1 hypothetical protein [Nonomuraea thailandensis]